MEKQKCHCNGSRGTDCDWCGGSGWKTLPTVTEIRTTSKNNSFNGVKQQKNKDEKAAKKDTHKKDENDDAKGDASISKSTNLSIVEVKEKQQNNKENKKSEVKRKSFDQRIKQLKISIKDADKSLLDESIAYLQNKIYKLNSDIIGLEKLVTKKQKKHFTKIKAKSINLIQDFQRKFKLKNIEHIPDASEKKLPKQQPQKGNESSKK